MQTFENLLLQNCSTVFLDIAHKYSLGMCNKSLFKWWCHYQQNNSKKQFELQESSTTQQNSEIFYPNSPWVYLLNSKDGQNSKLS